MFIRDLLEVNMSPSALKDFMDSTFTKTLTIGFEFELIVPGLEDFGGHNSKDDVTKDMPFPIGSDWMSKAYEWLISGKEHSTAVWINKQLIKLQNDFATWIIQNIFDYIKSPAGTKKVKQAISKAIGTTDQTKIIAHYNAEDNIYEDAISDVKGEFTNSPATFKKYLRSIKINTMADYAKYASLKYPYKHKYKPTIRAGKLAKDFADYTKFDVEHDNVYHAVERKSGLWIFEPDNSVFDPNREGAGIELVSPPMKFREGMSALDTVWNWAKQSGITTNESTGMHVGISLPNHELANIDYVKLILFLGDNHILQTFNRVDNEYARSMLDHIQTQTKYLYNVDVLLDMVKNGIHKLAKNAAFQAIAKLSSKEKYITVNIKNNYIEFRSAGGDYLSQKNLIMNTIARYIKAMSIAADPEAEKEEYYKKLYKLISPNLVNGDDTVNVFIRYAAGELTKKQVKSIIKSTQRRRSDDRNN